MSALAVGSRARRAARAVALASLAACSGGGGITVTPPAIVAGVRFVSQPSNAAAGQTFSVSVELISSAGARVTTANDVVVISVGGGATLSGSASAAAANGLATFNGLSMTKSGTTFNLSASSGAFSTQSSAFAVRAGPVSSQTSTVASNPASVSVNVNATLTLTLKDAFGNAEASVPVSLSTTLAGATFTPATGTTDANGVFTTTFRSPTLGALTINATVDGVVAALTTTIVVAADLCGVTSVTLPLNTSGTLNSSGCVVSGNLRANYRLLLSAITNVRLTVTPVGFVPRISVFADASGEGFSWFQSTITAVSTVYILPPGSYTLRVSAESGSGTFTFAGAIDPASLTTTTAGGVQANAVNTCPARGTLVATVTNLAQALQTTDCKQLVGTDNFYYDVYFIYSTRGCTITMRSSAFDAWLDAFDLATGAFIRDDDDAGGGTDAQLTFAVCNNNGNALEIRANSNVALATGAYTLTVTIQGTIASVAEASRAGRGEIGVERERILPAHPASLRSTYGKIPPLRK